VVEKVRAQIERRLHEPFGGGAVKVVYPHTADRDDRNGRPGGAQLHRSHAFTASFLR
jgi:hypothetical protein